MLHRSQGAESKDQLAHLLDVTETMKKHVNFTLTFNQDVVTGSYINTNLVIKQNQTKVTFT